MTDPLAPLLALPGVADAADRARDALAGVHRLQGNRRGWPENAATAAMRAARASATIESSDEAVLKGALRVAQALDGDSLAILVNTWTKAPLQALAKLHMLAAADLVEDDALGRPRVGSASRLDLLAQLVTGATSVPAPVLAAVVHGELLGLAAFGSADGLVARAASRLVCVASGLDPHNLGVPELSWMRRRQTYLDGAAGFATGETAGVGSWLIFCCGALEAGAAEATSIAEQ